VLFVGFFCCQPVLIFETLTLTTPIYVGTKLAGNHLTFFPSSNQFKNLS